MQGGAGAAHLAQDQQLSGREPGRATARWARPAPGPECDLAGDAAHDASARAGSAAGGAVMPAVGDKRPVGGPCCFVRFCMQNYHGCVRRDGRACAASTLHTRCVMPALLRYA